MTDIELKEITLIVVVVDTTKETGCLPLVAGTIDTGHDCHTIITQTRGKVYLRTCGVENTITLQSEGKSLHLLSLETGKHMEIMTFVKLECVF